MRIKTITWQHRHDFSAVLSCEHCAHEQKLRGGYDDDYYHNSVLPAIRCQGCGHPRTRAQEEQSR